LGVVVVVVVASCCDGDFEIAKTRIADRERTIIMTEIVGRWRDYSSPAAHILSARLVAW